ncbi:MAG: hypothetical protein JSS81_27540 [Acidobacteria bacterium]|nr:hypothetical protein [Acidobacteriota bacterium]
MARIEDNGAVRHHYNPPPKPKTEPPKTPPKKPPTEPAGNAATRISETQNLGDQQRLRLDRKLDREDRLDSGFVPGGVAGSTAAQFALNEQTVRSTGIIKVKGDATTPADFVTKVEADIQKLAPNSTLERRPANSGFYQQQWDKMYGRDTLAVVRNPENSLQPRVGGSEQGYRLLDQLRNNPHEVTINYLKNNAYAAPRDLAAFGSVTNPGKGSGVDIFYDPNLNIGLPSRSAQGSLVNAPVDSAIVLGHEMGHASHMQRGTAQNVDQISSVSQLSQIFGSQGKDNVFTVNGRSYRESDNPRIGLREEYRNVGFEGHVYGSEPTENSLRRQLGIPEERISYQGQSSYQPIGSAEALVERNLNRLQTLGDGVVDGVRGSRNSALIGAGFGAVTALAEGKDAQGVATDAAVGAGVGVTQEVIQKVVTGPASTTAGMTPNAFRAAASQVKGAAVAGAVINTGFAVYEQWDNLQNDATRSQAVGTIAGEAVVGAASGAAGAYAGAMAGAAIGSIVPGVGTVIGGVVGFAVGAAAGYLADQGLRGLGVDKLVAGGVTAAYDGISNAASTVAQGVTAAADTLADGAKSLFNGAVNSLGSIFG